MRNKYSYIFLLITFAFVVGLLSIPPTRHVEAQTNEISCPSGSTAIPATIIINPATGRVRQLLCMDTNGNVIVNTPSTTLGQAITATAANPFNVTGSGTGTVVSIIDGVSQQPAFSFNETNRTVGIGSSTNGVHLGAAQGGAANDDTGGKLICAGSTVTKTFTLSYVSVPTVFVFDETTKGGANLTAISNSAFTVSCTGATDALDYFVRGNPN